ncbi:MAG: N-acyl homoserine lactonase family protein [Chloroflexota bacterium]|nr:N-acyl homoserine lactonase family protein [Chloroflexota bacterium]
MRLYLLDLGRCDVDKGRVLTPGSGEGERVVIPIVGYLIEADDGRRILVDSGMHKKHVEDPDATFGGTPFGEALTPIMRPEDDVVHRLAELGLGVGDVDVLVGTHFHFDHAGNHGDFGASRVVTQRAAYEFARANPGAFPRDIWDLPQLRYELVDGDVELAPGVELIESSGHVPGHMSVLVRLPASGPMLLTIDAVYVRENLDTDNWAGQLDPEAARASARRLAEIAERENATMVFGHDPAQWAGIRMAPAFYE